jgi:hypothetical protein
LSTSGSIATDLPVFTASAAAMATIVDLAASAAVPAGDLPSAIALKKSASA